jgi:hypothetical protein
MIPLLHRAHIYASAVFFNKLNRLVDTISLDSANPQEYKAPVPRFLFGAPRGVPSRNQRDIANFTSDWLRRRLFPRRSRLADGLFILTIANRKLCCSIGS